MTEKEIEHYIKLMKEAKAQEIQTSDQTADNKSKEPKCKYCFENESAKVKEISVVIRFQNPMAHSYPEIAYWNESYKINCCPFCGRKITDGEAEK